MTNRIEIGKKIASARVEMGLNQSELAQRARTHRTTISEIENGHFTGSHGIFERVVDVFDYIEMFYNRIRRHSHLDGMSPEAFEAASK